MWVTDSAPFRQRQKKTAKMRCFSAFFMKKEAMFLNTDAIWF